MNREKISTYIGLTLLMVCFAIALVQIFSRGQSPSGPDGRKIIRFAHWQLESGLREAMDVLAEEYEQLHPDVDIQQIAIPERIYPQWLRTQLVGGTASDIIELGTGMDDEMAARFFLPISQEVEKPNPYNTGTDLADTPWRETFIDGMVAGWNFRPTLLEYYGVPLSMFTIRIYYNEHLWKRIFGDEPPPSDYDGFMAACRRVNEYAASTGKPIIPIAGSKANGPMLIDRLFSSQTQKLMQEIAPLSSMRVNNTDIGVRLLQGAWSVDSPAYVDALHISREVGQLMQPGYASLGREDATFYFVQGRALMITTGSWDSPSFRAQSPFPIKVIDIPIPPTDHPRYGHNVQGPASESEISTGLSFGITRGSPHPDIALDFLRFITSRPGNTSFSRVSGWLPSVVAVEPSEELVPFLPRSEGYLGGFTSNLNSLGANTVRIVNSANNRLVGATGSVEQFQDVMRTELPQEVRADLERIIKTALVNINRQDVFAAAQLMLTGSDSVQAEHAELKLSQIREGQAIQEANRAWIELELNNASAR
ncbi:MAG: extracellular solute-binding protein [Verrucomicrobiota bacterium]